MQSKTRFVSLLLIALVVSFATYSGAGVSGGRQICSGPEQS